MDKIFRIIRGKRAPVFKRNSVQSKKQSADNVRYVSDFNIPFVENKDENSWSRVRNVNKRSVHPASNAESICKENGLDYLKFSELVQHFSRGLSAKKVAKMYNKRGYGERTLDKYLAVFNKVSENNRK